MIEYKTALYLRDYTRLEFIHHVSFMRVNVRRGGGLTNGGS